MDAGCMQNACRMHRFYLKIASRPTGEVFHEVGHRVGLATARAARRFGRGQLLLHQVMRLQKEKTLSQT